MNFNQIVAAAKEYNDLGGRLFEKSSDLEY